MSELVKFYFQIPEMLMNKRYFVNGNTFHPPPFPFSRDNKRRKQNVTHGKDLIVFDIRKLYRGKKNEYEATRTRCNYAAAPK